MTDEDKELIEKKLRNFKRLKSRIETRLYEIAEDNLSLDAIDYKKAFSGNTNDFYSAVEDLIEQQENIEESYPDLMKKIIERERIKSCVKSLPAKKQRFVEYKYFEEMSDLEIGTRLRHRDRQILGDNYCEEKSTWYSVPTLQRLKNECLKELYRAGIINEPKNDK